MGALGLAVGLHPDLPRDDSLRSLFGSLAPFAFCFCRIPPSKALTLQAAISWCPVLAVAMGVVLAVLGLRPLFVDSGGLRLAGVGHPAFLAGVALVGVYASLLAMYREDRPASRYLLVANLMILLLTGARAPLACAAAVILLSLLIVPSRAIDAAKRGFLLLAAVCAVPVILALGADLSDVRVINLLSTDATHLSGRERLWPLFEAAADSAPWFGWGIGAGNIVVPPGSAVAKLLRTWAAHNEYLRIRVEGGWIGLGALIVLFVLWVGVRSARLPPGERWIMRFVFLALAVHAVTDNVLISTPACVLFTFAAAVFATAEERPPRHDPDGGRGRPVAEGDARPGPL
jgi:O-antigen ligase